MEPVKKQREDIVTWTTWWVSAGITQSRWEAQRGTQGQTPCKGAAWMGAMGLPCVLLHICLSLTPKTWGRVGISMVRVCGQCRMLRLGCRRPQGLFRVPNVRHVTDRSLGRQR